MDLQFSSSVSDDSSHLEEDEDNTSMMIVVVVTLLLLLGPKRVNAQDAGDDKGRHHSTESDLAEGSSQLAGKKCRRDNEGSPARGDTQNEEGAGPEILQAEAILSKAMEDYIQQVRQRVDSFTHQVSGSLVAGKAYFLDASNAFEEGILQLHQKILETWEEDIEGLRNVDIVNEEISTRLREARDVLEKLQASASNCVVLEL